MNFSGLQDEVPKNGLVMRNIHQALNYIASHAAHIYVLWGPDLANPAYRDILAKYGDVGNAVWKELQGRFAPLIYQLNGISYPAGSSYLGAIGEFRRLHEAISLIAGKMPHPVLQHVGGVVYSPTVADIGQIVGYVSKTMRSSLKHLLLGSLPIPGLKILTGLLPRKKLLISSLDTCRNF